MTEHVCLTEAECQARRGPHGNDRDGIPCMICDAGLGQCKHCGAAESEMDDWPTCEAYRLSKSVDIHAERAMKMFGVTADQVTVEMRRAAKAAGYHDNYGISGEPK